MQIYNFYFKLPNILAKLSTKFIPPLKQVGFLLDLIVRGGINNAVRSILHLIDKEDYSIPDPKEIINDYDYSDYTLDCEYGRTELKEWREKLSRK